MPTNKPFIPCDNDTMVLIGFGQMQFFLIPKILLKVASSSVIISIHIFLFDIIALSKLKGQYNKALTYMNIF